MPNTIYGSFMLPQALAENAQVFQLEKTDSSADSTLLATIAGAKGGDIAVITTKKGEVTISRSAYFYDEATSDWVALDGFLDASKCIIPEDITMAGNYTAVGNLTKTQNGTATFNSSGKSVMDAFMEILSKRLQPTITAQPSVTGFTLTGAGKVEAGTKITSAQYGTARLNGGSYTYGPATGVTATSYSVDRVTAPAALSANGIATTASGTDDNSSAGFIIGDQGGDNVVSSLAYKVTVAYDAGVVANDNLGSPSDPVVQIAAGTKAQTTSAYTPFRKYFYGGQVAPITLNSAGIRGLTGSNAAGANGSTFSINIPEGCTQVVISYPATLRDLTSVKDKNAFGTDIVSSFVKTEADVEGANGYTAIGYKVFTYTPAAALGTNTFDVTI